MWFLVKVWLVNFLVKINGVFGEGFGESYFLLVKNKRDNFHHI